MSTKSPPQICSRFFMTSTHVKTHATFLSYPQVHEEHSQHTTLALLQLDDERRNGAGENRESEEPPKKVTVDMDITSTIRGGLNNK